MPSKITNNYSTYCRKCNSSNLDPKSPCLFPFFVFSLLPPLFLFPFVIFSLLFLFPSVIFSLLPPLFLLILYIQSQIIFLVGGVDLVAFGSIWIYSVLIDFLEIITFLALNIFRLIFTFFDVGMALGDRLDFIVLFIFLGTKAKASGYQRFLYVPARTFRQPG